MAFRKTFVRVIVETNGNEKVLGQGFALAAADEDEADWAAQFLAAWERARNDAEYTLRLFGAEALARALVDSEQPAEKQQGEQGGGEDG